MRKKTFRYSQTDQDRATSSEHQRDRNSERKPATPAKFAFRLFENCRPNTPAQIKRRAVTSVNYPRLQRKHEEPEQRIRHVNSQSVGSETVQRVFSQNALTCMQQTVQIAQNALNHYQAFDTLLDNQGNNLPNNVGQPLAQNINTKTNIIRGRGTAEMYELMNWGSARLGNPYANLFPIRGPGGGAGVDLRDYTYYGMGGQRLDVEVKHTANDVNGFRNQIDAAVAAHGANQTIKVYASNAAALLNQPQLATNQQANPNTLVQPNCHFVRALTHYYLRPLVYFPQNNESLATLEVYDDLNVGQRLAQMQVGWF